MANPSRRSDAAAASDSRPLSRGWQERHSRISRKIETVAQRLFAERGFSQVRVEDVAAQVPCSVRTVTRYFPTKEELLLAGRRRMNQQVLQAFEALSPDEDAPSAVWGVWMSLALRAQPGLGDYLEWMRAASTAPEVMDRAEGERRRQLRAVLTEIVAASLKTDPTCDLRPQIIAATLESANAALIDFWVRRGGTDDLQTLYRQAT
jgi:AcrR family transcriptional regulator